MEIVKDEYEGNSQHDDDSQIKKRTTGFNVSSTAPSAQAIQNKRAKLNRAKMQTGDVVMDDSFNTELPVDFAKELEKLETKDAHISDPKETWPRPVAPALDPALTKLVFQQMEIDEESVPELGTVAP
ncbi:hypothetical protein LPJ73_004948, partial [Coemansia sp. RSA 2703]